MLLKPTIDIRDCGKSIVLFTNDTGVYKHFHDCPKVLKRSFYEQTQGKKTVFVGVDLYFLAEDQKWLRKELKNLQ